MLANGTGRLLATLPLRPLLAIHVVLTGLLGGNREGQRQQSRKLRLLEQHGHAACV